MLSLIFLIAFPFLLWKAWQTHQTAKASVSWPTTTGTIATVERVKRLFRSLPRVVYAYAVDGKDYRSERVSFASGYRPKEVDEVLSRYSVGQTVPVHYKPEQPGEAVLEAGSGPRVTAQIRILVVCFIIIVVLNVVRFFFDPTV